MHELGLFSMKRMRLVRDGRATNGDLIREVSVFGFLFAVLAAALMESPAGP